MPRLIDVPVPVADAAGQLTLQTKQCWYLVYRVKNVGWRRTVIDPVKRTELTVEAFEAPIRWMPHFVLESLEGLSEDEGLTAYRGYLDRLVPALLERAVVVMTLIHRTEVWGLGSRVWGLGSRVWGLGSRLVPLGFTSGSSRV